MTGRKKQNKKNNEKSTREENAPENVSPVVEEHIEELSDGNDSDGVSTTSQVKYFICCE